MDKEDRQAIRDNFDQLVDVTHNIDGLIERLILSAIFDEWMVAFLLKTPAGEQRSRNFYQMMQDRGRGTFHVLLDVLRETENHRAVDLLENNSRIRTSSTSPITKKLSSNLENRSWPSDVIDASKTVKKSLASDEKYNPTGTYVMREKFIGHALIINIEHTKGMSKRRGSRVDVEKATKLFESLGYTVFVRDDLVKEEIIQAIDEFISNPALASVDSTVFIIMCHGTEYSPGEQRVKLYPADGKDAYITSDYIIDQFLSEKCKLAKSGERKAKLFFFVSCRIADDWMEDPNRKINMTRLEEETLSVSNNISFNNDTSETDSSLTNSSNSNTSDGNSHNEHSSNSDLPNTNSSNSQECVQGLCRPLENCNIEGPHLSKCPFSTPNGPKSSKALVNYTGLAHNEHASQTERKYKDLFVIYPTNAGCPSFRSEENGTWFIQKLSQVFAEHSWQYDFHTLMLMVDKEISQMKNGNFGHLSIEVQTIGVSKKLYFSAI